MTAKGHIGITHGEFSVCQFFASDAPMQEASYEYTRRYVGDQEAVKAFVHYCQSVAARMGWVTRVILTDSGDQINMEWKSGEGITFPPEHKGKLK